MKIIIQCVIAVFFSAGMAFAAQEESLNKILARMSAELELTSEQQLQVRPILKEDMLKRQEFYDSMEGEALTNRTKMRSTMRKFRREMNEQLVKVLTPEQMKKLIGRQNIRESLNKDVVDFSEGVNSSGINLATQGGSLQF